MKAPNSGGSGEILQIPPSLPVKPETSSGAAAASQSTPPPPSSSDNDCIYVPSYSRKSATPKNSLLNVVFLFDLVSLLVDFT